MIIYIAAFNGDGGQGGVERVVSQQKKILENLNAKVIITDRQYLVLTRYISNKKMQLLLYPVLISIYFLLKKICGHKFLVISHGYSSPFYFNNLLVAHGNMKCYSQTVTKRKLKLLSGSGVMAIYEKCAGKLSDKIWAVSNKVKNEWVEYYSIDENKIDVVRNYIDLRKFNQDGKIKQSNITFVGRLEKGKGTAELIDICNSCPNFNFTFISSIPAPKELSDLNNVTINVGVAYNAMPQIYQETKLLILPSMYEGFELVTVEALCCGTPVVGYNVGAVRELHLDKHPGVFLVENKDSLIATIGKLMSLTSEEYLKLREDILSKRDVFSEKNYEEIMKKAFNYGC
ncbi:glycosyltransferase family 4 protein [Salmonella enterica subsp. enterica serovar Saintpaul]|nr:glycosyltransferase family 4 protein [Salmonella enterica subsp. enterica serovar Saintpaul]